MQIAQVETLPIDENIFIEHSGLLCTERGVCLTTNKFFFLKVFFSRLYLIPIHSRLSLFKKM